jgi:hypothetical protein
MCCYLETGTPMDRCAGRPSVQSSGEQLCKLVDHGRMRYTRQVGPRNELLEKCDVRLTVELDVDESYITWINCRGDPDDGHLTRDEWPVSNYGSCSTKRGEKTVPPTVC